MAKRKKTRRALPRIVVRSANPRRRKARKNPARPRRRRTTARRNPHHHRRSPARRTATMTRRRHGRRRRNPMGAMGPWIGLALGVGVVTLADGLFRAYAKKTPMIANWGGLVLKVIGAWWFSRKVSTQPLGYALGALALADLAERAVIKAIPTAATTAGWVSLPPGLVGPLGFPNGVGYPNLSGNGIPPRIENNPMGVAYGYAQADMAGYPENIM